MNNEDVRRDKRAPVIIKFRFRSATVEEFIEQYSRDISRGGIFVKHKEPLPIRTLVKFEFKLKNDEPVIRGVGRVVWVRDMAHATQERPPGMGIKFIKLDDESRLLIERVVGGKEGVDIESGPPGGEDVAGSDDTDVALTAAEEKALAASDVVQPSDMAFPKGPPKPVFAATPPSPAEVPEEESMALESKEAAAEPAPEKTAEAPKEEKLEDAKPAELPTSEAGAEREAAAATKEAAAEEAKESKPAPAEETAEKPAEKKAEAEKPAEKKAEAEKPAEKKAEAGKPAEKKVEAGKPAEKKAAEKPVAKEPPHEVEEPGSPAVTWFFILVLVVVVGYVVWKHFSGKSAQTRIEGQDAVIVQQTTPPEPPTPYEGPGPVAEVPDAAPPAEDVAPPPAFVETAVSVEIGFSGEGADVLERIAGGRLSAEDKDAIRAWLEPIFEGTRGIVDAELGGDLVTLAVTNTGQGRQWLLAGSKVIPDAAFPFDLVIEIDDDRRLVRRGIARDADLVAGPEAAGGNAPPTRRLMIGLADLAFEKSEAPPEADAGAPPAEDALAVVADVAPPPPEAAAPPAEDAGPPPVVDAGARPERDVTRPPRDAGAPPPPRDAGRPPPPRDAGPPPPPRDAGPPPPPPPPREDAGGTRPPPPPRPCDENHPDYPYC